MHKKPFPEARYLDIYFIWGIQYGKKNLYSTKEYINNIKIWRKIKNILNLLFIPGNFVKEIILNLN